MLALITCAPVTTALAADVDCEAPRPAWCEPGFACVPSSCLAALRVERDEARADVLLLRATRPRRFHADLTCGPGVAGVVTEDLTGRIVPSPLACVVGLAFRLTK